MMSRLYIWQLAIHLRRSARCPQHTEWWWLLTCRFQSGTAIVLRSGWMTSGKQTDRCWTKYSGGYSSLSPVNKIPAPRAGITTFSVQKATSGVGNRCYQHGLQIAQSIVTNISSSGMSASVLSVQRSNLEIMSLLTSNTPGGIATYIECSAMPTPRQPHQEKLNLLQ